MGGALDRLLARAVAAPRQLSAEELVGLLALSDPLAWEAIFAAAREVRHRVGRETILPRGLIECSNVCSKDCFYCGIRKSNAHLRRYRLSETEVLSCIGEVRRRGYPALAFQAGEIESEENTRYYERLLAHCQGLEVTLSLGEQEEAVYRRWKVAGAMRYLLRIETSNPRLYAQLHPTACSFERRAACLRTLKRLGYVTGTGVMIGLPGQTYEDLARDILFFEELDADMIGMGPYIPHPDTPLAAQLVPPPFPVLETALKMIALVRLSLHNLNLVAATALEALDPQNGRTRGLAAGANVIMPNVTPEDSRVSYDLYPGKAQA